MSADNKLSSGKKVASVIIGALLAGFLWRVRGSHGFGSMWGIIGFTALMTLFIFSFYGNRAKIKYEILPIGCILGALTTPAWGCVNTFMGGVISGVVTDPETGEQYTALINGYHGMWLLLMTGFSLLCLYGIFVGSLFSKREYKFYHYVIYAGVFLAVAYLSKLTFSHAILKEIAPEISESFASGLKSTGSDVGVKQAYIDNFMNLSALKKIPFGRSYTESIEHISYACGALALILTALIVFRDKVTGAVSLIINLFGAVGITVSDVFLINEKVNTGNIIKNVATLPSFLNVTSWGLWEYFTGFFIGLGIMLIIALLPNSLTAGRHYRNEAVIQNRYARFAYNYLLTFTICIFAVPVRALGMRAADLLEALKVIGEDMNDTVSLVITAAVGVAAAIIMFFVIKKNIINKNLPVPVKLKPMEFALKATPWLVLTYLLIFIIPNSEIISAFSQINNLSGCIDTLTGKDFIANTFAVASALIFFIVYLPMKKRILSHH